MGIPEVVVWGMVAAIGAGTLGLLGWVKSLFRGGR